MITPKVLHKTLVITSPLSSPLISIMLTLLTAHLLLSGCITLSPCLYNLKFHSMPVKLQCISIYCDINSTAQLIHCLPFVIKLSS